MGLVGLAVGPHGDGSQVCPAMPGALAVVSFIVEADVLHAARSLISGHSEASETERRAVMGPALAVGLYSPGWPPSQFANGVIPTQGPWPKDWNSSAIRFGS